MKRFATLEAMLLLGILVGALAGYFFAKRNVERTVANPNTLTLTFPETYFAELPKADNNSQRLIEVDQFVFEKVPNSETEPSLENMKVVVLPRGRLEVAHAQR